MKRPDYKGQLSEIAQHLDCDAIDAGAILFVIREREADLLTAKDKLAELTALIELDADMKEAFAEPDAPLSPKDQAEADRCIENFRNIDLLKECLAWVAHWELDRQSNLCPTPESLLTLQNRITERLAS